MKLFDENFLFLDIGTYSVCGSCAKIYNNKVVQYEQIDYQSFDTIFAIKQVIDKLDKKLNLHFTSAYITGNFGEISFSIKSITSQFHKDHLINDNDVTKQIFDLIKDKTYYPMHIIPLRYDLDSIKNVDSPIGFIDNSLTSFFSCILYKTADIQKIETFLRKSHVQIISCFDSHFLQNHILKQNKAFFIEFGFKFTSVSIWINSVPLFYKKFDLSQKNIHEELQNKFNLSNANIDLIKHDIADVYLNESDRFIQASSIADFTKYEFNEIVYNNIINILNIIKNDISDLIEQYNINQIYIFGGGSKIKNINNVIKNVFNLEVINTKDNIICLSKYILKEKLISNKKQTNKNLFIKFFKNLKPIKIKKIKKCPIIPSSLNIDLLNNDVQKVLKNTGITRINIDIYDGIFTNIKSGNLSMINKLINSKFLISINLMLEVPKYYINELIKIKKIDTIIIPLNTYDIKENIQKIKLAKKKCGVSIYTSDPINKIPFIKYIDEIILIENNDENSKMIYKIKQLIYLKNKYNLSYKIIIYDIYNNPKEKQYFSYNIDYLINNYFFINNIDMAFEIQNLTKDYL